VAHILVIDHHSDLCITMQDMLQTEGHNVSVAADGEQGIKLQRKQPGSLLITDIFMPNKENMETIRDFREEFPNVSIIAMSGGGRVNRLGIHFTAQDLGADVIRRKPNERPSKVSDSRGQSLRA
jgi:DNA-binding NtrC family response regulator